MKKEKFTLEIPQELEIFLRKKKVLTKFKKNAEKTWKPLTDHFRIISFGGSFLFESTPEGSDFWLKLIDEYDEK